jgi:hypothetical protein
MNDDLISTRSVSADVVETEPIVLRETEKIRLVFLSSIVERSDPLRGYFVYQRKGKHDVWEDIRTISLATLKSGEGYALELHSGELSTLMDGLLARKELFERYGILFGDQKFIRKATLPNVVQSLVDSPGSEFEEALHGLNEADILSLSHRVDLSKLDALLNEWRDNQDNGDEGYWQDLLTRNAWVFSQLTGSPVVLLEEKAYVGGKSIANTGGGEIDYLVRNELTDNVSFIEIKTPATPIVSQKYRSSGSFVLDKDVTGGMIQVLGYKQIFDNEYYRSYNARCYLIIGRASNLDTGEARSFELFRNALAGVQVLTFDEVERRLVGIREALVL